MTGVIGGKYFFSDEDTSPFIHGGFGMGAAKGAELNSVAGFSFLLGAGMVFLRTSDVHLEVLAEYHTLMAKNDEGTPGLGIVGLKILF